MKSKASNNEPKENNVTQGKFLIVSLILGLAVLLVVILRSEKPPDTSVSDLTKAPARVADNNKPVSNGGDVEGPEIESHLGKDDYMIGAFPPDNRPLISAEYEDDGSGIDANTVRFLMDDEDITDRCKITEEKVTFKPAKTLKSPKHYEFKVIVFDKSGNPSELVWMILLKPC